MLETLIQYDKELFLYLNTMGNNSWDAFWLFMTNKWGSIPVYIILLFLAYRQLGLRKLGVLLVAIALLLTATDQLANFFKDGIERLRPCHDITVNELMRLVKSNCGGKFGYFSAHAANSFGVAFFFVQVLKSKYRFFSVLLLLWAALFSYSRIYLGVHFPLDTVTGIVIGSLFGWLFAKLFIFALHKYRI